MTSNLQPLLNIDRIKFLKKIESKKCVFDILTDLLIKGQSEITKNQTFDALIAREKLGSTTIGNGVSIPRAHIELTNPRAALLILKKGINLNAADKVDVRIFIAILIPNKKHDLYSNFISQINLKLATNGTYNIATLEKKISSKNHNQLLGFFESLFENVRTKSTILP